MSRGEAELSISKLTSVFHYLSSLGLEQLCALANLGCTHEAGTSLFTYRDKNMTFFRGVSAIVGVAAFASQQFSSGLFLASDKEV